MNQLKYFIHDVFCIDLLDKGFIDSVFVTSAETNKKHLSYDNMLNHPRVKKILKINTIYRVLYGIDCPIILMHSTLAESSELAELSEESIIPYLVSKSFKKYTLTKEEIVEVIKVSKNINLNINSERELITILENRHSIQLNYNTNTDDLFSSYTDSIQKKYNSSIESYFVENNKLITNADSNIFTNSIHLDSQTFKNRLINKYSSINDYHRYILHNDCCFQRLLNNSNSMYVDASTPNALIKSFLRVCNKLDSIPIIFSNINFDSDFKKYSYTFIHIKNPEDLKIVPRKLLSSFIYATNDIANYTEMAKHNIRVELTHGLRYRVCFDNLLGKNKNVDLHSTSKHNSHINELLFKLFLQKSYNHLNGIINIIHYFQKHNVLDGVAKTNLLKQNTKCILITDNRENIMNVINLNITLSNLETSEWDFVFIGSKKSIEFIKSHSIENLNTTYINDTRLDKPVFNIEIYNDIMKDSEIWAQLGEQYEYCLIIQDDSAIMKKGLEKSEFIKCDYVGSPWIAHECNKEIEELCGHLCGNGGLSYRNIEVMKRVCDEYSNYKHELFNNNLQHIPEDVYFARYVPRVGGYIPTTDISREFGSEQVVTLNSFGFHKIWAYTTRENVDEFFSAYV